MIHVGCNDNFIGCNLFTKNIMWSNLLWPCLILNYFWAWFLVVAVLLVRKKNKTTTKYIMNILFNMLFLCFILFCFVVVLVFCLFGFFWGCTMIRLWGWVCVWGGMYYPGNLMFSPWPQWTNKNVKRIIYLFISLHPRVFLYTYKC